MQSDYLSGGERIAQPQPPDPGISDNNSADGSDVSSFDVKSTSDSEELGPYDESKLYIKTILQQLAEISTAIKKSGSKYRFQKADAEIREDQFLDLRPYLVSHINIATARADSSPGDSTHLFLDSLKSTSRNYEQLTSVQQRLIRANILRRNRILYANSTKLLSKASDLKIDGNKKVEREKPSQSSQTPLLSLPVKRPDEQGLQHQKPVLSDRTATKVGSDFKLQQVVVPKASSTISKFTHIRLTQDYPLCPKICEGNDFVQCPLCSDLMLNKDAQDRSKWR